MPLSNKFQAKWLQRVNEEFISIVEAEYKCHSDKPFWESRPTRFFAIEPSPETIDVYQKEYNRLKKVINSNYYKKGCLENIFADYEEILELIAKPRKLLPGIVFPAVNEYEDDINYPLVSFSRYDIRSVLEAIDDIGTKGIDKFKDSCNHIFEIIYNFTSIEYRNRGMYFLPQLAYFQEIKGDSYLLSLVMQIWCEWNKNSFQKYDMPSICATGIVSDNGEVLPIDKAEIKLEAAYNMGFDYVLFPKGNEEELFEQLKSLPNKDKILFFDNIKDVFEWLGLLTDKNRNIRVVKLWVEEETEKPGSEMFADYFRTSAYENPIEWKKIIKGNFEEKLDKLKVFKEEYCKYKNINVCSEDHFCWQLVRDKRLEKRDKGIVLANDSHCPNRCCEQKKLPNVYPVREWWGSCHEDAAPRLSCKEMVGKLASDSSTEGADCVAIGDRGIFNKDNIVVVSEINIAIEFFIKNKDNFFTQNVDIAKVWEEYLKELPPKLKLLGEVSALADERGLFFDGSLNLIDITEKVKKSTEPQINYNGDIDDLKQFLYEFIRTFCFGKDINSLFQPVVWKSTIYRNLYTKMALQILSSNKELLKRYLIEIVSDVDNLVLGFEFLNQQQKL